MIDRIMALTTYKWSIEEWHDLVNSGVLARKRVELLEGEIIAMSPEKVPHRNTNDQVVKYIENQDQPVRLKPTLTSDSPTVES